MVYFFSRYHIDTIIVELAPPLLRLSRTCDERPHPSFNVIFNAIYLGRRKCREVWPDATLEKVFNVSLDVVMLIIPLLLMGVMYGLIVNHLWKGDRGMCL